MFFQGITGALKAFFGVLYSLILDTTSLLKDVICPDLILVLDSTGDASWSGRRAGGDEATGRGCSAEFADASIYRARNASLRSPGRNN